MIDIRKFDLNLLLAFDALITHRSVTIAASRLGIGQPAMSHALKRLRDLFQDPLLVRIGGAMQPTRRALDLKEPVAAILREINRSVLADPQFRPNQSEQVFRIGAPDYILAAVLPALLTIFSARAPRSRILVQSVSRDSVADRLADGSIDLAIGYYPDQGQDLSSETLFHEDHVCLFDREPCGFDAPVSLDDYLSVPHFLVSLRCDFVGVMDHGLSRIDRQRFVQFSSPSFLAVPLLLKGRRAIAVVPSRLAQKCHAAMALTVSPPPLEVAGFDIMMVWHARTDADLAQHWLRDQVRAASTQEPSS